mmetsp:Transcript_5510/g.11434  ORF Transcript_5510/g.11434 Transcript_5510/m.11434 type:complete len:1933 (-) Transcript_5510:1750-7548(-)
MQSTQDDSIVTFPSPGEGRRRQDMGELKRLAGLLTDRYIKGFRNKSDLITRLSLVHSALQSPLLPSPPPTSLFPSLPSLSSLLSSSSLLKHRDKTVRLHATLCCMEIFALYAPDPPWEEKVVLTILDQAISQVGNLSHCTGSTMPHYHLYVGLLHHMATVRTPAILVEMSAQGSSEAEETLGDLVSTLLTSVRRDHPADVGRDAASSIAAVLEEFDGSVPVAILDDLLRCIAEGPTVTEDVVGVLGMQTNPAFMCAAAVLVRTEDRISSSVAGLLNGVLEGRTVDTSLATEDVHAIIYELHRIVPGMLTTVVGTAAGMLQVEDSARRLSVVRLLGRLFASGQGDMANKFASCFRSWNDRVRDIDLDIRRWMARCLCVTLRKKIDMQTVEASLQRLLSDPEEVVRIEAMEGVCDAAFENLSVVGGGLLRAVGRRAGSRIPEERRKSVTGLGKIYAEHYVCPMLTGWEEEEGVDGIVQLIKAHTDDNASSDEESSDDESVEEEIVSSRKSPSPDSSASKLAWIPSTLLSSLSFSDGEDPDMRSRVISLLDHALLPPSLTKRGLAMGLCLMLLHLTPNATLWFHRYLSDRRGLQRALGKYIQLRQKAIEAKSAKDPDHVTLDLEARSWLGRVFSGVPFPSDTPERAREETLDKFHAFRDRRIFDFLAKLADGRHLPSARRKATEGVPARLAAQGTVLAAWSRTLVRRCGHGGAVEPEVVSTMAEMAESCVREREYAVAGTILKQLASILSTVGEMGGGKAGAWSQCVGILSICINLKSSKQKSTEATGVLDVVCKILNIGSKVDGLGAHEAARDLELLLLKLVQKEGSVEQCRHAVAVLCRLSRLYEDGKEVVNVQEERVTVKLFRLLTKSNVLCRGNKRLNAVLISLGALMDGDTLLVQGEREIVDKAIRFAWEDIILDQGGNIPEDSSSNESEEHSEDELASDEDTTKSKFTRSRRTQSPKASKRSAQNPPKVKTPIPSASIAAAMDLLVHHINSLPLGANPHPTSSPFSSRSHIISVLSHITSLLSSPIPILRLSAFKSILRLCQAKYRRESLLMLPTWHCLGNILLDKEESVRRPASLELTDMITGRGSYGPLAPSLRFVSLLVLLPDADVGVPVTCIAAASPLGKNHLECVRQSYFTCVNTLRRTCQETLARCRALEEGEKKWEKRYKMLIMPEFVLPFGVHLLFGREETPSGRGVVRLNDEEAAKKHLRKRIKFLLDPLILSLGDQPDNISFLLRMVEVIGDKYMPASSLSKDAEELDPAAASAKLKSVCRTARDVLLKYIKTDVNLEAYPGTIQLPRALFLRNKDVKRVGVSFQDDAAKEDQEKSKSRRASKGADRKNLDQKGKKEVDDSLESEKLDDSMTDFNTGIEEDIMSSQSPPNNWEISPIHHNRSPAPKSRQLTVAPYQGTPLGPKADISDRYDNEEDEDESPFLNLDERLRKQDSSEKSSSSQENSSSTSPPLKERSNKKQNRGKYNTHDNDDTDNKRLRRSSRKLSKSSPRKKDHSPNSDKKNKRRHSTNDHIAKNTRRTELNTSVSSQEEKPENSKVSSLNGNRKRKKIQTEKAKLDEDDSSSISLNRSSKRLRKNGRHSMSPAGLNKKQDHMEKNEEESELESRADTEKSILTQEESITSEIIHNEEKNISQKESGRKRKPRGSLSRQIAANNSLSRQINDSPGLKRSLRSRSSQKMEREDNGGAVPEISTQESFASDGDGSSIQPSTTQDSENTNMTKNQSSRLTQSPTKGTPMTAQSNNTTNTSILSNSSDTHETKHTSVSPTFKNNVQPSKKNSKKIQNTPSDAGKTKDVTPISELSTFKSYLKTPVTNKGAPIVISLGRQNAPASSTSTKTSKKQKAGGTDKKNKTKFRNILLDELDFFDEEKTVKQKWRKTTTPAMKTKDVSGAFSKKSAKVTKNSTKVTSSSKRANPRRIKL